MFDSYIFDMDGTLWDAVDSYCAVWNRTFEECGVNVAAVTRPQLEALMGTPLDGICRALAGDTALPAGFMERLHANEVGMMPSLDGRLYPDVRSTLEALKARGARLFMVSNCDAGGVPNFLRFTGLEGLIEDFRAFGDNGCEKDVNIAAIVERYNLSAPVYVGDTAGDAAAAHKAGLPFAWAAYGFGRDVTDYEIKLDKFSDLNRL